ncbi:hypothetical protein KQI84_10375 [bacterium]|nr:hypothetical protein [bacterium]
MAFLLLKPRRRSWATPEVAEDSTQVYRWPALIDRLTWIVPLVSIGVMVGGLALIRDSLSQSNLAELTTGLLMIVAAGGSLVLLLISHLTLAREIRFTRDRLVIHQTGREPVVLAYSNYQRSWVVDLSHQDSVRFIVFHGNRGCTVLSPPDWFLTGLMEIVRIQHEEGWYDPQSERMDAFAHDFREADSSSTI